MTKPKTLWKREPNVAQDSANPRPNLHEGGNWFGDKNFVKTIGKSIRAHFDGTHTCATYMPDETKLQMWRTFMQTFYWEARIAKKVFRSWHHKLSRLLTNLVDREKGTKLSTPIDYLTDEARVNLRRLREEEGFKKRSKAGKENRAKGGDVNVHYGGSLSAAGYVAKMASEGINITPSEVHVHFHCKEGADGSTSWNDDKSRNINVEFRRQLEQAGLQENSPEALKLYLKVTGGYSVKNHGVYGLGTATEFFYQPPSHEEASSSRVDCTPSPVVVLQS